MNSQSATPCQSSETLGAFSFCSLWVVAGPIITGLLGAVTDPTLKSAINALLAAGNAFCSGSKSERLAKFGIQASGGNVAFLESLSDMELEVLSGVQRAANAKRVTSENGVGVNFF